MILLQALATIYCDHPGCDDYDDFSKAVLERLRVDAFAAEYLARFRERGWLCLPSTKQRPARYYCPVHKGDHT